LVVALAALALFLAVRWPLLHGDCAIAGLTVDSSILALMGKKMFDGRGFDIFAWGVGHLGPLTSAITAAWAGPLMLLGVKWPWPLAVRVAAMTEVAIGIALLAWATARIDRRAAALLALLLAVGPPELFRMSLYPLGHEMAFVLSAVVLALATQHVTATPGRGWLSTAWGELAIGVASGLGWWVNKTMAPAIAATLIVLMLRSELFASLRPNLRFKDRFLLRVSPPLPGLFEAVLFVLHWSGVAVLAINTAGNVLHVDHAGQLPFVSGPFLDGLILIGVAQATLLIARPPRFPPPSFAGLRGLAVAAAGFALGVAPAVMANLLDWYPHAYVAGLVPQSTPDSILSAVELRGATVARAILGPDPAAGVMLAIALLLAIHHRRAIAAFVSLTPRDWGAPALFASAAGVTLASSLLLTNAFYSRYLLAGVGPLFALLALEGLRWWDSRRMAGRAAAVLAGGVVFVTLLMTGSLSRRSISNHAEAQDTLRGRTGRPTGAAIDDARAAPVPDPRIVLDRVAALGCRVTYTDYFQAYNYRLLSEESSAWIPYLGNIDQTPDDTALARTLPGRRCYVTTDGVVFPIPGDLPLRGKGRRAPTPPGGSRPARPPG